jgi:FtsP/CotA-like multicopper oxidase with cupredoxin domain
MYFCQNVICFFINVKRFDYHWTAVVPGTNWYHSHTAYQRGDGLFGMYIVRLPPDMEVHSYNYDFDLTEHYIIVQEWFHGVKNYSVFTIQTK